MICRGGKRKEKLLEEIEAQQSNTQDKASMPVEVDKAHAMLPAAMPPPHLGEVPALDEVPRHVARRLAVHHGGDVVPGHPGGGVSVNEVCGTGKHIGISSDKGHEQGKPQHLLPQTQALWDGAPGAVQIDLEAPCSHPQARPGTIRAELALSERALLLLPSSQTQTVSSLPEALTSKRFVQLNPVFKDEVAVVFAVPEPGFPEQLANTRLQAADGSFICHGQTKQKHTLQSHGCPSPSTGDRPTEKHRWDPVS